MENLTISGILLLLLVIYFFMKTEIQRQLIYFLVVLLGMIPLFVSGNFLIIFIITICFCVQELTILNEKKNLKRINFENNWNIKLNALIVSLTFFVYIFSLLRSQKASNATQETQEVDVFILFLMASVMALQFARKKLWKL
jgi:hypothetical protein